MVITQKGSGRLNDKMWFLVSSLPDRISANHKQITSIHSWQEEELYSAKCTVVKNVNYFLWISDALKESLGAMDSLPHPRRQGLIVDSSLPCSPGSASCNIDSSCWHSLSQSFPCLIRAVKEHIWSILLLEEKNKFSDGKHRFSEIPFVQTHSSRPISSTNCFVKPSDTYSCSKGFWMQISLVHTSCSWMIMFLLTSLHHEFFWARFGLNQVYTWRMCPKFHAIKVHWIIQVMMCSLQYIW